MFRLCDDISDSLLRINSATTNKWSVYIHIINPFISDHACLLQGNDYRDLAYFLMSASTPEDCRVHQRF